MSEEQEVVDNTCPHSECHICDTCLLNKLENCNTLKRSRKTLEEEEEEEVEWVIESGPSQRDQTFLSNGSDLDELLKLGGLARTQISCPVKNEVEWLVYSDSSPSKRRRSSSCSSSHSDFFGGVVNEEGKDKGDEGEYEGEDEEDDDEVRVIEQEEEGEKEVIVIEDDAENQEDQEDDAENQEDDAENQEDPNPYIAVLQEEDFSAILIIKFHDGR